MKLHTLTAALAATTLFSAGAFAQEGALLFHIADRRVLWLELRVRGLQRSDAVVKQQVLDAEQGEQGEDRQKVQVGDECGGHRVLLAGY